MTTSPLGRRAQDFMHALHERLPEDPSTKDYKLAVADTLRARQFKNHSPGLRKLAESAFADTGSSGIKDYLQSQASLPLTPSQLTKTRKTIGPALQAILRPGHQELTDHDTLEAFGLSHGLQLLQGSIMAAYEAPVVADVDSWGATIEQGLRGRLAELSDAHIESLAQGITGDLDAWQRHANPPSFADML